MKSFFTRLFPIVNVLLIFGLQIDVAGSQRTHARQGINREPPPPIRIPSQGSLIGREMSLSRTQKVMAYLGIPYAQPPTGQLRFRPPVTDPLPSWSGVKNATNYASSCQQVADRRKLHEKLYIRLLPSDQPDPGVSEDCLYLNVFVPDGTPPPEKWPVMVWFHGGDFNTGTPAIWDASIFVIKQKVLVVTVAYRLNILGFFTTTDAEAPGNYGMLDQIAALDWVQKNIQYLDGAADNVIIYGHSSGAISVGLHILSPLSRGKFAKAIAMSGDAIGSVGSPQAEAPIVDLIADKFGCFRRPTTALMECLRRVESTTLVRETAEIETWGPIVDFETNNSSNPFLPAHPRDILESNDYYAVPLLVGYTNNEQALAYIQGIGGGDGLLTPDKFESMIREETASAFKNLNENDTCEVKPEMLSDAILFYYAPHPPTKDPAKLRDRYLDLQTEKNYAAGLMFLAERVSRRQPAYAYRFDYRPRTTMVTEDVPLWAGVPHMFELQFVWGLPYMTSSPVQWNAGDKKMADIMMTLLANFARVTNPSQPSLSVKWEAYSEENPGVLLIDRNIEMSSDGSIDFKALAFWNDYYPKVFEEASNNCCNVTSASEILSHTGTNLGLSLGSILLLSWL